AGLAFHTADEGQANFAQGIGDLVTAGADVVVDDVFYYAEPMFQDGVVAQAVDSSGVPYFSSAGNQARQAYENDFHGGTVFADGAFSSVTGAPHFSGGTAHNFNSPGPSDSFQSIALPAHSQTIFSFQWDSPFFTVSGGAGSPNDMDAYLLFN